MDILLYYIDLLPAVFDQKLFLFACLQIRR